MDSWIHTRHDSLGFWSLRIKGWFFHWHSSHAPRCFLHENSLAQDFSLSRIGKRYLSNTPVAPSMTRHYWEKLEEHLLMHIRHLVIIRKSKEFLVPSRHWKSAFTQRKDTRTPLNTTDISTYLILCISSVPSPIPKSKLSDWPLPHKSRHPDFADHYEQTLKLSSILTYIQEQLYII